MSVHTIDLLHLDLEGLIASYLILDGEPTLLDPGPASTLPRLRAGLAERGMGIADLRHLLLTHVHLDHAGTVGHLVAENPRLQVHVHLDGAPHLSDPERLVASTRRTFGAAHDALWGEVHPVPRESLRVWEPKARAPLRSVRPFPTPGHVDHHLAYLHEGVGTLFTGDALGIVLAPAAPTYAPTPPPAIDLAAWRSTLTEMRSLGAERAAIAHFGLHDDVAARTYLLEEALDRLEARVREALRADRTEEDARAFDQETRASLARVRPCAWVDRYFEVFSPANDWRGMERFVRTRSTTRPGEERP